MILRMYHTNLDLRLVDQEPNHVDILSMQTPLVAAGMAMEDGKGVLADGTRYEKRTSEEFGADGYWLRTTVMRGVSAGGKVSRPHGFDCGLRCIKQPTD